jgi:hypothetical protein
MSDKSTQSGPTGHLLLAQIEPSIVDHVTLLHDIGAHGEVAGRSLLADLLKAGVVVGMGSGSKTLKHALLGEEERTDVDGEDGALLRGALLLELDIFGEKTKRLGLVLEHVEDTLAAGNNDDVKVLELVVGVLVVHVGLDGEALDGRHGSRGARELDLERLARCRSLSAANWIVEMNARTYPCLWSCEESG